MATKKSQKYINKKLLTIIDKDVVSRTTYKEHLHLTNKKTNNQTMHKELQ